MFQTKTVEKIKTNFTSINFLSENKAVLCDKVEKCGRARWQYNTARALCVLDKKGYGHKHTQNM
jgi:hypothetical protein